MASPILHIKDSYYFDVPKIWYPSKLKKAEDFPEFWIKLDDDFQHREAVQLFEQLEKFQITNQTMPERDELIHQWEHWKHQGHANHSKPLDVYLELKRDALTSEYTAEQERNPESAQSFADFAKDS